MSLKGEAMIVIELHGLGYPDQRSTRFDFLALLRAKFRTAFYSSSLFFERVNSGVNGMEEPKGGKNEKQYWHFRVYGANDAVTQQDINDRLKQFNMPVSFVVAVEAARLSVTQAAE